MEALYDQGTIDAVRGLRNDVTALIDLMAPEMHPAIEEWQAAIDRRLLPRLRPDFPLSMSLSLFPEYHKLLSGQMSEPAGHRKWSFGD